MPFSLRVKVGNRSGLLSNLGLGTCRRDKIFSLRVIIAEELWIGQQATCLLPLAYDVLRVFHPVLIRTQLGVGPINLFQHCGCTTLEGFDILKYFTVTFVKRLYGCIEPLELFLVSGDISFWLWGRVGLLVRLVSVSDSLGGRDVDRFNWFGLPRHPFLWCLVLPSTGGLLPWRRINGRRVAEKVRGRRGLLINYKGGWRGRGRGLSGRHWITSAAGDKSVSRERAARGSSLLINEGGRGGWSWFGFTRCEKAWMWRPRSDIWENNGGWTMADRHGGGSSFWVCLFEPPGLFSAPKTRQAFKTIPKPQIPQVVSQGSHSGRGSWS